MSHPGAIQGAEASFIESHEDLIALNPTTHTPLREALEKLGLFHSGPLFEHRRHKFGTSNFALEDPMSYTAHTTFYQNHQKIDGLVNAVICVAGFIMLVAPLWTLLYVSYRPYQLTVITIFIALFLAMVQSVSVARPFESLAATAA